MRLCYLANIRLPTEKAHGVQIMKTCEALARAGVEVELVVPTRRNDLSEMDPFAYYQVEQNFVLTRLPVADPFDWPLGFYLQGWLFARRAARYIRTKSFDVIFGREELPLYLVSRTTSTRVVWESHLGSWNIFARRLAGRIKNLIVISSGLKEWYVEKGIDSAKIVVADDGVDLAQFAHPQKKTDARARLGLSQEKKIAMYIGRLDGWKGVETFLARSVGREWQAVVIGGEQEQIEACKKKYPDAIFLGYRPYAELPDNQAAADVLVLPNTARDEISARFTSPLKLFAYMASGAPMVVSDLPSLRAVVDDSCAYFARPDDAESFAAAITRVLADPEALQRAAAAKARVVDYSWERRAEKILRAIAPVLP